jgi:hypothetical protein
VYGYSFGSAFDKFGDEDAKFRWMPQRAVCEELQAGGKEEER